MNKLMSEYERTTSMCGQDNEYCWQLENKLACNRAIKILQAITSEFGYSETVRPIYNESNRDII